jgi:outer membrane protein
MLIRSLIDKKVLLIIMPAVCMLICGGCTYVDKVKNINATPAIMTIPAEKVQQIDMIELKKAPESEPVKPEIAEPEKAEYTLSLEECRALTLENNLDLRAQLINPSIAQESVNQEEAKFESTFSVGTNYTQVDTPTASTIQASESDSVYTTLGVEMPLRTGGTLSFDLADQFYKSNLEGYEDPKSYTAELSASISQPLLRNAGKNASTYSIRVAQYNSSLTNLRTKAEAIRILADVDKSYWRLYASRRMLEVTKQQYDLAKTTFEETKRFVEVGVKPRIEIIRTEAGMAKSLKDIISAENDVRVKERDLKRTLNKRGLGMETKTIIIPSSLPDPLRYEVDREKMVQNALLNRMEMLELELQIAQDSMNIDFNRNQALPLLSFDYTFNLNGLASPTLGEDRGDAYDMLYNDEHHGQRVGLKMTVPLGNKKATSALRKSIYERAQRLTTKEGKEAEIRGQVLNQIDTLEANWQGILASRQNTILSDEQYKAEKRQYELGLVSSKDVLTAQTELAQAQMSEIQSITDYQISIIDLAYATGTLLGAAKVEWEPVVPVE